MQITQEIKLDLQRLPSMAQCVIHAKQGEGFTRAVRIALYNGGQVWTVPSGTVFEVAYCKPDRTGGTYNSYTTDSAKPAVTASGNALTVVLIPQMMEAAGLVRVEVHMCSAAIMAYAERLSTFTFWLNVQASAESGITSEDYWSAAQTDKVVLLNTAIGATANVETTHNVSEFVATPHVGDAVVGSDGYTGKVTAASGTSVTISSTGQRWASASATPTAADVAYTATIGETDVQDVDAALDALNVIASQCAYDIEVMSGKPGVVLYTARISGTVANKTFTCGATLAEITTAYNAKNQLLMQVQNGINKQYSILPLVYIAANQKVVFSGQVGNTIMTATLEPAESDAPVASLWKYTEAPAYKYTHIEITLASDAGTTEVASVTRNGVEIADNAERIEACKEAYLNGGTIVALSGSYTYVMSVADYSDKQITLMSLDAAPSGGGFDFYDWLRVYFSLSGASADHWSM